MRVVTLDAHGWKSIDDFYTSVLAALGAPASHGRNLDALVETIVDGGVNAIDPPFRIHITNAKALGPELRAHLRRLRKIFGEISADEGIDVSLTANASLDF